MRSVTTFPIQNQKLQYSQKKTLIGKKQKQKGWWDGGCSALRLSSTPEGKCYNLLATGVPCTLLLFPLLFLRFFPLHLLPFFSEAGSKGLLNDQQAPRDTASVHL